jgi:hypothetical protein
MTVSICTSVIEVSMQENTVAAAAAARITVFFHSLLGMERGMPIIMQKIPPHPNSSMLRVASSYIQYQP